MAAELGARVVPDPGTGLNAAIRQGTEAAREDGAAAALILPADLPLLSVESLDRLLDAADAALAAGSGRPLVVISPSDARNGTNGLLLSPPDVIRPSFGIASFEAHVREARDAGTSLQVVPDPGLGFDLDTPEDFERLPGDGHRRAARARPARARGNRDPVSDGGRLLAVALPELPEVHPGDDLGGLIVDALRELGRDDASLRPEPSDVLVVTQKIVSKAEGRIVDLRDVQPRPEAVEFAERWDRDARQIEVVLREAAEVVRMERGVLICRTHHGFVCANAGVDASNVGTAETVTLLPEDPDRSAREIRARIAKELGVEMAVIVSDSFGRPWRFGIVDVALGVAGFNPLDDQRGRPDADGRIMHATVVAVADEICSAAELASGKIDATARSCWSAARHCRPAMDRSGRRGHASGDGPVSVRCPDQPYGVQFTEKRSQASLEARRQRRDSSVSRAAAQAQRRAAEREKP